MWELFAIVIISYGNATYGGPIISSGFKTKEACVAHYEKMKKSLPVQISKGMFGQAKPAFEHMECIPKDI